MSKTPEVIISDTSCLIILDNAEVLNLLKNLYGQVVITPQILKEFNEPIPDWIVVRSVSDQNKISLLEMQVDLGEASAMALALEVKDCIVIIDDLKARRIAEKLNLRITGTMGIIISAKRKGLLPSVKPIIEKIKSSNFRISPELEAEVLRLAGEADDKT
jgi:predicted nucleic acid-binding protein